MNYEQKTFKKVIKARRKRVNRIKHAKEITTAAFRKVIIKK